MQHALQQRRQHAVRCLCWCPLPAAADARTGVPQEPLEHAGSHAVARALVGALDDGVAAALVQPHCHRIVGGDLDAGGGGAAASAAGMPLHLLFAAGEAAAAAAPLPPSTAPPAAHPERHVDAVRGHRDRLGLRQDGGARLLGPGHELGAHALAARLGHHCDEVDQALVLLRRCGGGGGHGGRRAAGGDRRGLCTARQAPVLPLRAAPAAARQARGHRPWRGGWGRSPRGRCTRTSSARRRPSRSPGSAPPRPAARRPRTPCLRGRAPAAVQRRVGRAPAPGGGRRRGGPCGGGSGWLGPGASSRVSREGGLALAEPRERTPKRRLRPSWPAHRFAATRRADGAAPRPPQRPTAER